MCLRKIEQCREKMSRLESIENISVCEIKLRIRVYPSFCLPEASFVYRALAVNLRSALRDSCLLTLLRKILQDSVSTCSQRKYKWMEDRSLAHGKSESWVRTEAIGE